MWLTLLCGVLAEQTRIYRLLLNGRIRPEHATKMTFMLDKIRSSVEAIPPEARLLGSGFSVINIISIESGRYITREARQRLAAGEDIYNIAPNDLPEPITVEQEPRAAEASPLPPPIAHHPPTTHTNPPTN